MVKEVQWEGLFPWAGPWVIDRTAGIQVRAGMAWTSAVNHGRWVIEFRQYFLCENISWCSDRSCEKKIHEHLSCLLSEWSEWWHLTVTCQPEEQNRGGADRCIAYFGSERFRALSSCPSQSHDLAPATYIVQIWKSKLILRCCDRFGLVVCLVVTGLRCRTQRNGFS